MSTGKWRTDHPEKPPGCLFHIDAFRPVRYTESKKGGWPMEVELKLEPGRPEPKVVILAGEVTPALEQLVRELAGLALAPIPIWEGDRALLLPQEAFLRFYTEDKGVLAQTQEGSFPVRLRLYELEERLDRRRFVRISNGEIVNLDQVTALDLSLTGTIRMTLGKGQAVCYVSRRYVKKIKETLQLERRRAR